jgi:hypothetical protein
MYHNISNNGFRHFILFNDFLWSWDPSHIHTDDVRQFCAAYMIIYFVSYLSGDEFLLSQNILHHTIQYQENFVINRRYLAVYLQHTLMSHIKISCFFLTLKNSMSFGVYEIFDKISKVTISLSNSTHYNPSLVLNISSASHEILCIWRNS